MQEQSNKQFYISDWHYGHANVIAFDNRPFKSLLEMDEALVDRWNAVVSPGDIVYVLGDMFWCKAQDAIPILRSLKGQKFLIKGNHDRCNDNKFLREFVKVTEYLEVKDSGRTVILCHYPIPCFKNHFGRLMKSLRQIRITRLLEINDGLNHLCHKALKGA